MNFQNTTTETVIYQASAVLKANNPEFTAGDICKLLGVDTEDKTQGSPYHKVALGVWKANQLAETTGGYTQETVAV